MFNLEGYRHIRGAISEEMAFRGQEQDFFFYFRGAGSFPTKGALLRWQA